jgi:hypothetical protein
MKSRAEKLPVTLAARVAAEDLRVGDDVAILNEIHEVPTWFWPCSDVSLESEGLVRIRTVARGGGTPLRVEAVCLPFVFLKRPDGRPRQVDVRRVQLVRLDRRYARLVRKALRARMHERRSRAQP